MTDALKTTGTVPKQEIAIMVAMDQQGGIGWKNDLPWGRSLGYDLKRFKAMTTGNVVVMGRKTYESIGRPLPNRQNIVVSSALREAAGIDVVVNLAAAYERAEANRTIFVIGGARLYTEALPTADSLYVTLVDHTFEADVHFPDIDRTIWEAVSTVDVPRDERSLYRSTFIRYLRRARYAA